MEVGRARSETSSLETRDKSREWRRIERTVDHVGEEHRGFWSATYLDVMINVELKRQLAKVDVDVISRLLESDGRVQTSSDVLEVDVPESDGWFRNSSVRIVIRRLGFGNYWPGCN